MLIYFLLIMAILLEVAGTLLLPATQNFSRVLPTAIMGICYFGSFFLLTFVIKVLPISIVYATWSGLGVFTVAIIGYFLFGQSLSWQARFSSAFQHYKRFAPKIHVSFLFNILSQYFQ